MPVSRLESRLWSYDVFVKEKLHRWVDRERDPEIYGDSGKDEQTEIEKRLDTMRNGAIATLDAEVGYDIPRTPNEVPEFGHGMLKYFGFALGHTNLNNGMHCAYLHPMLYSVLVLMARGQGATAHSPSQFYVR